MSLNCTRLDRILEAAWWASLALTAILGVLAGITSSTALAACTLGVALICVAIPVAGVRISRRRRAYRESGERKEEPR